ncbi:hypothetical protein IWX50DRAFT_641426 [Phyllosticta citricarpa]
MTVRRRGESSARRARRNVRETGIRTAGDGARRDGTGVGRAVAVQPRVAATRRASNSILIRRILVSPRGGLVLVRAPDVDGAGDGLDDVVLGGVGEAAEVVAARAIAAEEVLGDVADAAVGAGGGGDTAGAAKVDGRGEGAAVVGSVFVVLMGHGRGDGRQRRGKGGFGRGNVGLARVVAGARAALEAEAQQREQRQAREDDDDHDDPAPVGRDPGNIN